MHHAYIMRTASLGVYGAHEHTSLPLTTVCSAPRAWIYTSRSTFYDYHYWFDGRRRPLFLYAFSVRGFWLPSKFVHRNFLTEIHIRIRRSCSRSNGLSGCQCQVQPLAACLTLSPQPPAGAAGEMGGVGSYTTCGEARQGAIGTVQLYSTVHWLRA